MGTPFWAALRNSRDTVKSTSASIYSLPSRTMGSTRTTRSPSSGKLTSACAGRNKHRTKASRRRNIDAYPYTCGKPESFLIFDDSRRLGKQGIKDTIVRYCRIVRQGQHLAWRREAACIRMTRGKFFSLLFALLGKDGTRSIKHMPPRYDRLP